MVKHIQ